MTPAVDSDRFWSKVHRQDDGCWLWTAYKNRDGYGVIRVGGRSGRSLLAHRVAYEMSVGTIPGGLVIDHLCRVRHCVRPDHMEPVTNRENLVRGEGFIGVAVRSTHCPSGHAYTDDNLLPNRNGWRRCRRCYSEWRAARRVA